MSRYGIIDLGSNTIRLCIYEVSCAAHEPLRKKDIDTLLNYKVMAGLASHVEKGAMTEEGVKRAIKTINAHLRRASHFNCNRIDIFATAVLRNCSNSHKATAAIEEGIEQRICILSNEEEAHLGYLGAKLDQDLEAGTMVDIGGGSTELTRVDGDRDSDDVSLGQGSLSSFARFVRNILPVPIEMDAIACEFRGNLRKLPSLEPYKAPTLYGVGGSTRAAAKLVQQLDELQTRPREVQAEQVLQILHACRENPSAFGHAALKASAERVHTMVPGCVILAELFRHLGADKLVICKHGVREGYLIERMLGAVSAPPQAD